MNLSVAGRPCDFEDLHIVVIDDDLHIVHFQETCSKSNANAGVIDFCAVFA
jgi:hypothetical protein